MSQETYSRNINFHFHVVNHGLIKSNIVSPSLTQWLCNKIYPGTIFVHLVQNSCFLLFLGDLHHILKVKSKLLLFWIPAIQKWLDILLAESILLGRSIALSWWFTSHFEGEIKAVSLLSNRNSSIRYDPAMTWYTVGISCSFLVIYITFWRAVSLLSNRNSSQIWSSNDLIYFFCVWSWS